MLNNIPGPPWVTRLEGGQHQPANRLWHDRHAAASLRRGEVRRVRHGPAAHSETHRHWQRGGELGDTWQKRQENGGFHGGS